MNICLISIKTDGSIWLRIMEMQRLLWWCIPVADGACVLAERMSPESYEQQSSAPIIRCCANPTAFCVNERTNEQLTRRHVYLLTRFYTGQAPGFSTKPYTMRFSHPVMGRRTKDCRTRSDTCAQCVCEMQFWERREMCFSGSIAYILWWFEGVVCVCVGSGNVYSWKLVSGSKK